MKINDIADGEEYGAVERPTSRNQTPRQVKVLGIEVVQERVYGNGWTRSEDVSYRNVRKLKVKFLDSPTKHASSWDKILAAKKGATLVIEARQIVGPWSDLADDVRQKADAEARIATTEAEYKRRLRKLGLNTDYFAIEAMANGEVQIRMYGYSKFQVDKLLGYAEAGMPKVKPSKAKR